MRDVEVSDYEDEDHGGGESVGSSSLRAAARDVEDCLYATRAAAGNIKDRLFVTRVATTDVEDASAREGDEGVPPWKTSCAALSAEARVLLPHALPRPNVCSPIASRAVSWFSFVMVGMKTERTCPSSYPTRVNRTVRNKADASCYVSVKSLKLKEEERMGDVP